MAKWSPEHTQAETQSVEDPERARMAFSMVLKNIAHFCTLAADFLVELCCCGSLLCDFWESSGRLMCTQRCSEQQKTMRPPAFTQFALELVPRTSRTAKGDLPRPLRILGGFWKRNMLVFFVVWLQVEIQPTVLNSHWSPVSKTATETLTDRRRTHRLFWLHSIQWIAIHCTLQFVASRR